MAFKDRKDAGKQLAAEIKKKNYSEPYIIGLARGGIPVAYEVAKALKAPLDVLVIRKLGVPSQPEFGFGAVAPDGSIALDYQIVESLHITEDEIFSIRAKEEEELIRRIGKYNGSVDIERVKNREIIMIDDGIATGLTSLVAVRYLKSFGPSKIVLATPVCSPNTSKPLKTEADEVICLNSPFYFSSVAEWYEDFPQTTDEEVIELLAKAKFNYKNLKH